jgi:hypothetical protein
MGTKLYDKQAQGGTEGTTAAPLKEGGNEKYGHISRRLGASNEGKGLLQRGVCIEDSTE